MSSNNRTKSLLRILLTANGCGCGRPKPTDVFEPIPKPKFSHSFSFTTSSTTTSGDLWEAETEQQRKWKGMPMQSPKLMNSLAVEKESEDPYKDFRHSMLQMIFEKEIYSEADLKDLLECFLQLNSPSHHHLIVRAFTEICHHAFPTNALTPLTLNNNAFARASPI